MNKRLIIFVLPCLVAMSIVIWGIGCTSDEEKNASVESTKPGPESLGIIENQGSFGSHTGAESTFSKAKKAFAEGNYELAKELTKKAILQALSIVEDAKEGTSDQAKKKALPMLKEMWDVRSKINKALSADEEDDEKGFGSERETVAGPAYEPESESGPELALKSSSEPGQDSEKATDIFRETWGYHSEYSEPDQISDFPSEIDPEEPLKPKDPPPPPDEPVEPDKPKTCCGGYTIGELDALYYEDESQFWALVWSCADIEQCF